MFGAYKKKYINERTSDYRRYPKNNSVQTQRSLFSMVTFFSVEIGIVFFASLNKIIAFCPKKISTETLLTTQRDYRFYTDGFRLIFSWMEKSVQQFFKRV